MEFILFILIPDFMIGFVVALLVIKNNHQENIWQLINRGQPVSSTVHKNIVLTVLVLTLIGVFSALFYYITLQRLKERNQ
ncbi:hypothetical protein JOC85_002283 [Bacillus mesophilus]|uniref:Uncharacterized protein n=1 Tax=Bacillus mesophilus TaxID=1808955 RepID=A0A6M0Q725_9BACI|nr:hypothetical protein [Bacillus mesophilus]MBM7661480.1 hypothetical protein [Bacillus mesophilus]NEY72151.1 hypothetical protein [Bacillus mesophilus]